MRRLLVALLAVLTTGVLVAPAATAAPSGPNSVTVEFDCTHYGPFFTAVIPNTRNLLSDWVVTSPVTTEEFIGGQIQQVQTVAHVFSPSGFLLRDLTTGQVVSFGRNSPSVAASSGQTVSCEFGGLNTGTGTFVGPNGDTYSAFFLGGVFGVLH